jgi:hypothetical protein
MNDSIKGNGEPAPQHLESWMCGAKRRGREERCRAPKMANGKCRIHGGASLRGPASPRFTTGAHSKSFACQLPHDLRKRFEEAIADPELLSLRKFVALYEARLGQAIDRYSQLDPAGYRTDLQEKWAAFESANALRPDTDEGRQAKAAAVGDALLAIKQAIGQGGDEAEAWSAVEDAVQRRIAATNAEQHRLIAMNQMLSVDQAMELLYTIDGVLRKWLKDDPRTLSLIAGDLERACGLLPAPIAGDVDAGDVLDAASPGDCPPPPSDQLS